MRDTINPTSLTLGIAALALLGLTGCPGDDTGTDTGSSTGTDTTSSGPTTSADTTSDDTTTTTATTTATGTDTTEGSSSTGGSTGLLERVIEGLGGVEALDGLDSVELQSSGERGITDEGFNPGDPAGPVSTFDTTTAIDFENVFVRNDITRNTLFVPIPMPLQITEQARLDGGYVSGVESIFGFPTGDMQPDRVASTLKQAVMLNPHFLVFGAAGDPSLASEAGTADFDGETYDLLDLEDDVATLTLWVDQDTDLIRRVTTMENSHLHRDVSLEARYDDWQEVPGGVQFPNTVQILLGGELFHDETRSTVTPNPRLDPGTFDLPPEANPIVDPAEFDRGLRNSQFNQSFASLGIPIDGLQNFVMDTELAPGVHHLTGGTHHSLLVEQDGGLVVFEAPLNAQRCMSILDWVDNNLPGMPVTHIVLSHHHIDHSSCARTFVAAGATLVVHEDAEVFFTDVLAAPSTIEEDLLEQMPVMDPTIEVVPAGGSFSIPDGTNPIEVYELPSTHAADMVLPFVSSAGVAFTVDIYSPGAGVLDPAGPQEVLDALTDNMIYGSTQIIAGGHGGVGTLADLEMVAGG